MSGTLTRDELTTEIADIVGKSVSALAVSGALLQTRIRSIYLNAAQRRIARSYSFEELNVTKTDSATVTSVKTYPLSTGTNNLGLVRPKDIFSITLVDGANSRRLKRQSPEWLDSRFPDPTTYTTDRPSIYVRYGDQIDLFRIPNDAYTLKIRYPQWPTPFSSASQVSDFTNKDELLIAAGVMETYLALEEYQDVAVWFPRFIGLLNDAEGAETAVDWEPQAEPFSTGRMIESGSPWLDPSATPGDPLYGYE